MTGIGAADLTAAPLEFDVNGKILLLHPLRFRNWGEIERWVKDEIIKQANSAIKDQSLTQSQRQSIMTAAFREAEAVSVMDDLLYGGRTHLTTYEGTLRVICQSVNLGQQDAKQRLTLDDLDALFAGNLILMIKAYSAVRDISFPPMFPKEKEQEGQSANPQSAAPSAPQSQ